MVVPVSTSTNSKCTSGGPDPDSTDGASGASGSSGASGASGATGNQVDNCQQCVEEFDKRGGCADMHNGDMQAVQSKIPEGCGHCGDKAKDYCGLNEPASASGASGATGNQGDDC